MLAMTESAASKLLGQVLDAAPEDMARFGLTVETFEEVEVLGRGSNGTAFLLPDGGNVLKVTRDEHEAALAAVLIKAGERRGLPKVRYSAVLPHEIRFTPTTRPADAFVMVFERGFPPVVLKADSKRSLLNALSIIHGRDDEWNGQTARQWYEDLLEAGRFLWRISGHDTGPGDDDIALFLSEECDVGPDNIGIIERRGRWMAAILDLGQVPLDSGGLQVAKNRRR